jgi:hypothetical protein
MGRIYKYVVVLAIILFTSSVFVSNAHVLKVDGSIGAVLHVDPDDDPVVNQATGFYFDIKDTSDKFDPKQCDCRLVIKENGQEIFNKNILVQIKDDGFGALGAFTFPERAIYEVALIGTPKTPEAFQVFNLSYDIRVSRVDASRKPTAADHTYHYILFGIAFIAIFYLILSEKRAELKNNKKDN